MNQLKITRKMSLTFPTYVTSIDIMILVKGGADVLQHTKQKYIHNSYLRSLYTNQLEWYRYLQNDLKSYAKIPFDKSVNYRTQVWRFLRWRGHAGNGVEYYMRHVKKTVNLGEASGELRNILPIVFLDLGPDTLDIAEAAYGAPLDVMAYMYTIISTASMHVLRESINRLVKHIYDAGVTEDRMSPFDKCRLIISLVLDRFQKKKFEQVISIIYNAIPEVLQTQYPSMLMSSVVAARADNITWFEISLTYFTIDIDKYMTILLTKMIVNDLDMVKFLIGFLGSDPITDNENIVYLLTKRACETDSIQILDYLVEDIGAFPSIIVQKYVYNINIKILKHFITKRWINQDDITYLLVEAVKKSDISKIGVLLDQAPLINHDTLINILNDMNKSKFYCKMILEHFHNADVGPYFLRAIASKAFESQNVSKDVIGNFLRHIKSKLSEYHIAELIRTIVTIEDDTFAIELYGCPTGREALKLVIDILQPKFSSGDLLDQVLKSSYDANTLLVLIDLLIKLGANMHSRTMKNIMSNDSRLAIELSYLGVGLF